MKVNGELLNRCSPLKCVPVVTYTRRHVRNYCGVWISCIGSNCRRTYVSSSSDIFSTQSFLVVRPGEYSLFAGFIHLGAGLSCGFTGMAAGYAIGIVGDSVSVVTRNPAKRFAQCLSTVCTRLY